MWMTESPFLNWQDFPFWTSPLSSVSDDTQTPHVSPSPSSSIDEYFSIEGLGGSDEIPNAFSIQSSQLRPSSSFDSIPATPTQHQIPSFEANVTALPIHPPLAPVPSPIRFKSPKNTVPVADTIEVKRRGPGRPIGTREKVASEKGIRKHLHNASASKSRARFSAAMDKLWAQVPERKRLDSLTMRETDASRPLSRADKVEIVLGYMQELQVNVDRQRN